MCASQSLLVSVSQLIYRTKLIRMVKDIGNMGMLKSEFPKDTLVIDNKLFDSKTSDNVLEKFLQCCRC
jgi:hypothetical protein